MLPVNWGPEWTDALPQREGRDGFIQVAPSRAALSAHSVGSIILCLLRAPAGLLVASSRLHRADAPLTLPWVARG